MIRKLLFIGYGHYYLTYKKRFQKATDFDEAFFENYVYKSAVILPLIVLSFPIMAFLLHFSLILFSLSLTVFLIVVFSVPVGVYLFIRKKYYSDDKHKMEVISKWSSSPNKKVMIVFTVLLLAGAFSFFVGSIYIATLAWYPRNYLGW